MYNVFEHPPTTPLLLYLPPSPQPHIKATEDFEGDVEAQPASYTEDLASPPDYLLRQKIPIVSIRYRWSAAKTEKASSKTASGDAAARTKVPPLTHAWPTPLHDIMFAYDWIQQHLAPRPLYPDQSRIQPRRDLYVYGSHLGASLATSLALTESHIDQHMAVRGVATYNGIYNWTAFVNMEAEGIPMADDATAIQRITPGIPSLSSLFGTPADLFDAFLSPCLFFRTPGPVVPPFYFDQAVNRARIEEVEKQLENIDLRVDGLPHTKREMAVLLMGKAKKSYLVYPPTESTLTIPHSLLMHTDGEADAVVDQSPYRNPFPEAVHGKNSYATQADEMAGLLRRGVERYDWRNRTEATGFEFDEEEDDVYMHLVFKTAEAERRVQLVGIDAAPRDGSLELGEKGQETLLGWLNEHMNEAGQDGPKL